MAYTIKQLLNSKGIRMQEEHSEALNNRWAGLQALRGDLTGINIDDADISLRHIPGGDHLE